MNRRVSRRRVVAAAGALSIFSIVPRHVLGAGFVPPSGKIRVASIGTAGMGHGDVRSVAGDKGVTMVALCDIDSKRMESTAKEISKDHAGIKFFRDFRKMFDEIEKDIDAVTISTPDHTHAVACMAAIRRKKHVYCQKPLAHSIHEVRTLMKAAKEQGIITQLGNQGHSSETIRVFCEMVWDGAIGKVHTVECGCRSVNSAIDKLDAVRTERPPVPPNVEWDLWLGPALDRPYHSAYFPGAWRKWVPFGNGTIGDWICHVVDPVFWALDLGVPRTIVAETTDWDPRTQGDAYPKGDKVTFEFAASDKRGPIKLVWHSGQTPIPQAKELEEDGQRDPKLARKNETGAFVYGDKGVIMYGSHGAGGVRLLPEAKMKTYKRPEPRLPRAKGGHYGDWLNAIREGRKAGSDFAYGGPLTELALLGIIAMKTGQKLEWDGPACRFTNSAQANALINPPCRKGWELEKM